MLSVPSTMQYGVFLENPARHLSHLAPGSAIHLYRRHPEDIIGRIYMETNHIVIFSESVSFEHRYFKIGRPSEYLPEEIQWEGWLQIGRDVREIARRLGWIMTVA